MMEQELGPLSAKAHEAMKTGDREALEIALEQRDTVGQNLNALSFQEVSFGKEYEAFTEVVEELASKLDLSYGDLALLCMMAGSTYLSCLNERALLLHEDAEETAQDAS